MIMLRWHDDVRRQFDTQKRSWQVPYISLNLPLLHFQADFGWIKTPTTKKKKKKLPLQMHHHPKHNLFPHKCGSKFHRATGETKTYLEESMEARLLFLTPGDGLLTHFKEVDKRWVGLHQLFRLQDSKGRGVRGSRKWIHEAPDRKTSLVLP